MSLRQLVTASPETLTDMLLAADDRYRDAEELLAQDRHDGAVYLCGYSVEMWLKAACMRLRGATPTDLVKPALPPLKKVIQILAPAIRWNDFHDLLFFAAGIEALRTHAGYPPHPDQNELQIRVADFYDMWIIDMRYRRSALTEKDAWMALDNAWWIKSKWTQFG